MLLSSDNHVCWVDVELKIFGLEKITIFKYPKNIGLSFIAYQVQVTVLKFVLISRSTRN